MTINVEASQPVAITALGEVAHPGALALQPPADLLQALALLVVPPVRRQVAYFRRSTVSGVSAYSLQLRRDPTENQGGAAQFPLRAGDAIVIE